MKNVYSLSEDYLHTETADGIILIPLSTEKIKKEQFFSTEGIGVIVINMIKENKATDDILNTIVNEFDVEPEVALLDLEQFLDDLIREGIIL